jgi:uncharacterized protein YjiS (DUF1127 family)
MKFSHVNPDKASFARRARNRHFRASLRIHQEANMSATTDHMLINCQPVPPTLSARVTAAVDALTRTLQVWRARSKERRAFAAIDDRDLHDMRMTRWELDRELSKPFWRG